METLTKKQAIDFVWKRKRFKAIELTIQVDDLEHNAFGDVMTFWARFSGVRKLWFTDLAGNKIKGGSFFGSGFSIFLDLIRWPGTLLWHMRNLNKLERLSFSPMKSGTSNHVLYLRTDHWFKLISGGSVGHTSGVINALKRLEYDLTVFSSDQLTGVEIDQQFHLLSPDYSTLSNLPEIPDLAYNRVLIEKASENGANAKVIYQRYSLLNYSGIVLKYRLGIPLVLEYNGSFVWVANNWGGAKMVHKSLISRVEQLNLKHADLIVVVSEVSKDDLVKAGVDAGKILVNPNGVDPGKYHPAINGAEIRKQYYLEGKTVAGFIGTFSQWHGVLLLASAIQQLFEAHPAMKETLRFMLIGKGPQFPEVEAALQPLVNEGLVILPGQIPQEEGPEYLAACDFYLSPHVPNPDGTRFFGSPTKLFEYMAMGKGIVASSLDQIGDLLKHEQTALLTTPGDEQALIDAIIRITQDEALRHKLGAAARDEMLLNFSWDAHTKRIMETLNVHH